MGILNRIRETKAMEAFSYKNFSSMQTGFDLLDFSNGGIDPMTGEVNVGLREGHIWSGIGRSGSGKTTTMIQAACNIAKAYSGDVILLDKEKSTSKSRLFNLSGLKKEDFNNIVDHKNLGINTDTNFELIKEIAKTKEKYKSEIMVEDDHGKPMMAPTTILIDSWAMMSPDTKDGEIGGNMTGAQTAKHNNAFMKNVTDFLAEFNINLFIINHLTTKVSTSITPEKALMTYLKQDETAPGGSSHFYLADYYTKQEHGKKYAEDKDFGIKGHLVEFTTIKSRSNAAGLKYEMVLDQANGFDNDRSNFLYLKKQGLIGGGGQASFIKGLEDVKFTMKTFKEAVNQNDEVYNAYRDIVWKSLKEGLPTLENDQSDPNQNLEAIPDEED